jgi:uncharacterized protein (TIGR02646 family)
MQKPKDSEMIYVDRSQIPKPAIFDSSWAQDQCAKLQEFYRQPPDRRRQSRPDLDVSRLIQEVREPLAKLFHGKCAFCESRPADASAGDVEHLRPRAQAIDLDGSISPDHYWWLTFEWSNLYPICASCHRTKGTRFPVAKERTKEDAGLEELELEGALLLDPCLDDPQKHLLFWEDGRVTSDTRRGRVTIQVFDLNRSDLINERRECYERLEAELGLLTREFVREGQRPDMTDPRVTRLTDVGEVYAAMRRQFVKYWLAVLSDEEKVRQQASRENYNSYKQRIDSSSVAPKMPAEGYFIRGQFIEQIAIRNFKGIQELTIRVGEGKGAQVPWLALLGENASGKSSVLQAVAMTLIGADYLNRLPLQPEDVLRYGSSSGSVSISLTGRTEPIVMEFRRGSSTFEVRPSAPQVYCLGYGATRLLPRAGREPGAGTSYARVDNLFDPFIPLEDAEQWLLGLPQQDFDNVARALKYLLPLVPDDVLKRWRRQGKRQVGMPLFGRRIPLRQLSDGYQSVVALGADIMTMVLGPWHAQMEVAEAIVLIDELEAHLHPRWKMQVAVKLRQAFPRIQVLYATHDPLCVRNAPRGEIHVMQRDTETRAITATPVDLPAGLRADQILTGQWFGLSSTLDDDTLRLLEEQRALLLNVRTPENEARRQEITAVLRKRLGGFAETAIEQIALGVAAEVMGAEQKEWGPKQREEARQIILQRVKSIREG